MFDKNFTLFSVFLLVLVSLSGINAQSFGIRGGYLATDANIEKDGQEMSTYAEGNLMMGVFVDLPFGYSPVSIQPELNYVKRGYSTIEQMDDVANFEETISSVDVGAIMKFNFNQDGYVTFYAGAGPLLSYTISGQRSAGIADHEINFAEDELARTTFRYAAIGGLKVGDAVRFFAETRYYGSLGNESNRQGVFLTRNGLGVSAGVTVPIY